MQEKAKHQTARDDPLAFDDLAVGQRFTSGTHVLDEAQIKAYAAQFDPQPFHLNEDAAKGTCSGVLRPVVGIPRL